MQATQYFTHSAIKSHHINAENTIDATNFNNKNTNNLNAHQKNISVFRIKSFVRLKNNGFFCIKRPSTAERGYFGDTLGIPTTFPAKITRQSPYLFRFLPVVARFAKFSSPVFKVSAI